MSDRRSNGNSKEMLLRTNKVTGEQLPVITALMECHDNRAVVLNSGN